MPKIISSDTLESIKNSLKHAIDVSVFRKTKLDIPYTTLGITNHVLDIIYPDTPTSGPYKTVLLVHGGGFLRGNKRASHLSSGFQSHFHGYAIVSIDYRTSVDVKWPGPLHDVKAAIRFLRANANSFELDMSNVVVWGYSAGGLLADMLAATNGKSEHEDYSFGHDQQSSDVQALISCFGVAKTAECTTAGAENMMEELGFEPKNNLGAAQLSSAYYYVDEKFPPSLFAHGTGDTIVPFTQSVQMHAAINATAGNNDKAQLHLVPDAQHGDPRLFTDQMLNTYLDFIDKQLWNGANPYRQKTLGTITFNQD